MTVPDPREVPYAYHVAYQVQDSALHPNVTAFGSTVVYRSDPIGTPEDLDGVKKGVAEGVAQDAGWGRASVIILSWQPFPGWGKGSEA